MSDLRDAPPNRARWVESPRPLYRQLHPGCRGARGPTSEQVAAHQRARLHGAMIRAISERGYQAVTARELSALAGVSTRTIYNLFPAGKQECFLSTYDGIVRRLARRVATAYRAEHGGRAGLASGFDAFARSAAEEPHAARLALVEVSALGAAAHTHIERAHRLFESMVDYGFKCVANSATSLPPPVVRGVVAGVVQVVTARLLDDRAAELPGHSDELLQWTLAYHAPATSTVFCTPRPSGRITRTTQIVWASGASEEPHVRILRAAGRLAAQDGYANLSVARIAAAAGVSWKVFDKELRDRDRCLLSALNLLITDALALSASAGRSAADWPGSVQRALTALTQHIASDDVFPRAVFTEANALGPPGAALLARRLGDFAELLWERAPALTRPSEAVADAIVGAVWGIIRDHVARGAARSLPRITPQLSYIALTPVIGARAASQLVAGKRPKCRPPES